MPDGKARFKVGWIVIGCMALFLLSNFAVQLAGALPSLRMDLRRLYYKCKNCRRQPVQTESESSDETLSYDSDKAESCLKRWFHKTGDQAPKEQ